MDMEAALKSFKKTLEERGERIIRQIMYYTMASEEEILDAFQRATSNILQKFEKRRWKRDVDDWYRYLYRSTKNEFIKELKARDEKRRPSGDLHPVEDNDLCPDPDFDTRNANDPSPTQSRFANPEDEAEARDELRKAIASMPDLSYGERQTLLLELEGSSHEEVAAKLQTSIGTVRYWRCSGLKKLRKKMNAA